MKKLIAIIFLISLSLNTFAEDGLEKVLSTHTVDETISKLENILTKKGMTIFNRVNHSASAKKVGIDMRNTQLIIFGNPKIGSALMNCQQTAAIDLPLKALIFEDAMGKVWLAYNKISYLENRHSISGCDAVLTKMTNALAKMTHAAAN